ncbi:hypothetical protein CUJ83_14545 [Methanocella sp. CWC-04]|uniref:Uncharacterized protein n=1 Tax=Methanooceanicella nereidis TaxID=2052831 RepID=A0AAP2W8H9_9EURY|nr:hypothetical protein [Methanocella sp. CWC-04]MCD1296219.1 hypothetical protein [Methanocella sp. CWC-04]
MEKFDMEKELKDIRMPEINKRRKEPDLSVKHAGLKIITTRILALLLITIVGGMGIYSLIYTKSETGEVNRLLLALVLIYLLVGGLVAYKLAKLEFIGWFSLFLLSGAGILLSLISSINRGIMIGTIPILVTSIILICVLFWIKDLFGIKTLGDIFKPH